MNSYYYKSPIYIFKLSSSEMKSRSWSNQKFMMEIYKTVPWIGSYQTDLSSIDQESWKQTDEKYFFIS